MSQTLNTSQLANTDSSPDVRLTKNRVELVPWSMAATSGPSIIRCEDAAMVPFMGSPGASAPNWTGNRLSTTGKAAQAQPKTGSGSVAGFNRNGRAGLALSDDAGTCERSVKKTLNTIKTPIIHCFATLYLKLAFNRHIQVNKIIKETYLLRTFI